MQSFLLNCAVQPTLTNFDFLFCGSFNFIYFGKSNLITAKLERLKFFFCFIAPFFYKKDNSSH